MFPNPQNTVTQDRLDSLSSSQLTAVARIALADAGAEVLSWEYAPVYGGFGGAIGGTALYRFTLRTTTEQPCSLILKILYQRPNENEQSPYYWKREYEVYRSGIIDSMPAGSFVTPRIFALQDFGDSCWIWMEDIDDHKESWSLADYENIGLRLGRFNGAWLAALALPDYHWLTHNWHSAIVPELADTLESLDQLLEHSLVQLTLPIAAAAEIKTIWQEREIYRQALAKLPKTLCHIDAFRRNVLHRENDIVLLDWAVCGQGAIGEDLVALVAVSLHYAGFSQEYAEQVDQAVFAGYIAGLREAGWQGDEKLARLGYTCGMTLRGLAGVKQDINNLIDEANQEGLMRTHDNNSLEVIAEFFAEVRHFRLLKMAREAKELLSAEPSLF